MAYVIAAPATKSFNCLESGTLGDRWLKNMGHWFGSVEYSLLLELEARMNCKLRHYPTSNANIHEPSRRVQRKTIYTE